MTRMYLRERSIASRPIPVLFFSRKHLAILTTPCPLTKNGYGEHLGSVESTLHPVQGAGDRTGAGVLFTSNFRSIPLPKGLDFWSCKRFV